MYRQTDLAEIVSNPSPITLKYLDIWFSGSRSFGAALTKLGWPITLNNEPLLVWSREHGLRVDVAVEEKIMYARTIFHYITKNNGHILTIDLKKLSLINILNTMRAIWSQSRLLVNYQRTYNQAKSYVEQIPIEPPQDLQDVENGLKNLIWPNIIAVDYIGEYILSILTNNLSPKKKLEKLNNIQAKTRPIDWYTQAMLSWSDYKNGKLSEQDLLSLYGYVAGDDYELTRPRYYEFLKKPKPQNQNLDIKNMNIKSLEDLAMGMHYLRSEVKRRSLIWIAALRECLIENQVI